MLKTKQEKKGPSDYKEPYEFRLLIGDSIICQRYFKINNFNKSSLSSLELCDVIRLCAELIDEDLKSKTRVYTWHMTPLIFDNEEQMRTWFDNPKNSSTVRFYESIVLRDNENVEYAWDGENIVKCDKKFTDGTFTNKLTDKDTVTYEFAFLINGKKVASTIFNGVYPYYIRRNIDLSNTRGKFDGEDITRLGFESYILNRLVYDRADLIKKVVKEICTICSMPEDFEYTKFETFTKPNGEIVRYNLDISDTSDYSVKYAKEIERANQYLYGNKRSKSK